MKPRLALVEDEPDLLRLVVETMEHFGYLVAPFTEGKALLNSLERTRPDLVLLDLMLPDMDGLDICRQLRDSPETANLPILIMTARGGELDRVLGLELGADDYITKPFSLRELAARVKAVLRRSTEKEFPASFLFVGDAIKIVPESFEVFVNEEKVDLTSTEFKILGILAEKKGRVFSRDTLLNRLWGGEKIVLDRTVDVHIKNLREKLGEAGSFIRSIRGVGYKIEE